MLPSYCDIFHSLKSHLVRCCDHLHLGQVGQVDLFSEPRTSYNMFPRDRVCPRAFVSLASRATLIWRDFTWPCSKCYERPIWSWSSCNASLSFNFSPPWPHRRCEPPGWSRASILRCVCEGKSVWERCFHAHPILFELFASHSIHLVPLFPLRVYFV